MTSLEELVKALSGGVAIETQKDNKEEEQKLITKSENSAETPEKIKKDNSDNIDNKNLQDTNNNMDFNSDNLSSIQQLLSTLGQSNLMAQELPKLNDKTSQSNNNSFTEPNPLEKLMGMASENSSSKKPNQVNQIKNSENAVTSGNGSGSSELQSNIASPNGNVITCNHSHGHSHNNNVSTSATTACEPTNLTLGPNQPVTCRLCGENFPNYKILHAHEKEKHRNVPVYTCKVCKYCSLEKSLMIRHLRTHIGLRPFFCKICGYAFTTKANCERHLRKRHDINGKPNLDANIRYDSSQMKKVPSDSMYIGPDTVCMHCDQKFDNYWDLRDHMRLHDRKNYFCNFCSSSFSSRSNCVSHIMAKHGNSQSQLGQKITREQANLSVRYEEPPEGAEGPIDKDGKPTPKKISRSRNNLQVDFLPGSAMVGNPRQNELKLANDMSSPSRKRRKMDNQNGDNISNLIKSEIKDNNGLDLSGLNLLQNSSFSDLGDLSILTSQLTGNNDTNIEKPNANNNNNNNNDWSFNLSDLMNLTNGKPITIPAVSLPQLDSISTNIVNSNPKTTITLQNQNQIQLQNQINHNQTAIPIRLKEPTVIPKPEPKTIITETFVCKICDQKFNNKQDAMIHIILNHSNLVGDDLAMAEELLKVVKNETKIVNDDVLKLQNPTVPITISQQPLSNNNKINKIEQQKEQPPKSDQSKSPTLEELSAELLKNLSSNGTSDLEAVINCLNSALSAGQN